MAMTRQVVALRNVQAERDDAYRAIGRYTVQFSVLVANMRQILTGHLAGQSETPRELVDLSLSSLTAQPLADAFFGVCRAVSNFDADEEKIEKRLRKQVSDEITRRNNIAHGDWLVASWARPDTDPPNPTLVRVKANKIDKPLRAEDLTVGRIDAMGTEVEGTANAVWEFGTVCTKQDAYDLRLRRPATRVGNALKIEGGRVVFRGMDDERERIEKHAE